MGKITEAEERLIARLKKAKKEELDEFFSGGCPSEVELMDTLKEIDKLMEKYPHSHDSPLYQVPALLRKVSKLEYKRLRTRLAIVEGEVLRLWKKLGEPIPTVSTVVPPPTRSEAAAERLLAHLKRKEPKEP